LDAKSQPLEAVHHRLRVFAPQRARQDHSFARKGGEDQGTIRQALGTRQNDG
jgi:hypothetical protein